MAYDNEPDLPSNFEPTFDELRHGYDPDQVDTYIDDQHERLQAMTQRAVRAERRLAAAAEQMQKLHDRITELEREQHVASQPTTPIDVLGDRVQRILQEAWDGSFALRQNVEQEVARLREQAAKDAQAIVEEARTKARAIEEQIRRRRQALLQRVEQDKAKAIAQMTFLSDQRKAAVAELLELKVSIEAAVADVPTHTAAHRAVANAPVQTLADIDDEQRAAEVSGDSATTTGPTETAQHADPPPPIRRFGELELPPTMAVHVMPPSDPPVRPADTSSLVRSHRESTRGAGRRPGEPRVFDIEADDDL